MTGIEFDVSQNGLNAVLKDWELKAMQVVWGSPQGANSRPVWLRVNEMLGGGSISRASIINFLEEMRGLGVLGGEERTGKGGHHWVYFPALDESGFKRFIASTLLEHLMREFPDETRGVLNRVR